MSEIEALKAELGKLKARVEQLEDERQVRELLARYGYNADCCRDDEYVDLWTDDGSFDLLATTYGKTEKREWHGRQAIDEFIRDPATHHVPGFYSHAMHMQGNNVVAHIQGDTAVVNSYSIVLHDDKGNLRLRTAGNNQWIFKKVDGKWLIRERRRREIGGAGYTGNLDATPK